MSDVLAGIARLRRLVDALPEVGEDGEWLAAQLRTWLDGGAADGHTLEQTLGVATPRGARPWWVLEAQERKRNALQRLRDLVPAGGYRSEAEAIRAAASRYRAGRWRHDASRAPSDPDAVRDALRALLDATNGAVPCRRSIERALSDCDTSSRISCR